LGRYQLAVVRVRNFCCYFVTPPSPGWLLWVYQWRQRVSYP